MTRTFDRLSTIQRLFACFCLLLAFTVPAAAADDSKEDRLAAFMERMEDAKARLNLSPEQEAQIAPLMAESRDRRLAILERYGFDGTSKPDLALRDKLKLAKEMKAVRADQEKSLSRYLTPEQMREYAKIQDENRARMKAALQARKGG